MEIVTDANSITIHGNIKTVSHYQQIKSTIDAVTQDHKHIVIKIKDSISVTSSVIGYFTKLVQKDGIVIEIEVSDSGLMELFDELHLTSLFRVKRR